LVSLLFLSPLPSFSRWPPRGLTWRAMCFFAADRGFVAKSWFFFTFRPIRAFWSRSPVPVESLFGTLRPYAVSFFSLRRPSHIIEIGSFFLLMNLPRRPRVPSLSLFFLSPLSKFGVPPLLFTLAFSAKKRVLFFIFASSGAGSRMVHPLPPCVVGWHGSVPKNAMAADGVN